MTSASDRAEISALVEEAVRAGAGRSAACAEIGLHPRTLSRWSGPEGEIRPDLRPTADRPVPANRRNVTGSWRSVRRPNLPACRQAKSCRSWPTGAVTSPRNRAFTGCCASAI